MLSLTPRSQYRHNHTTHPNKRLSCERFKSHSRPSLQSSLRFITILITRNLGTARHWSHYVLVQVTVSIHISLHYVKAAHQVYIQCVLMEHMTLSHQYQQYEQQSRGSETIHELRPGLSLHWQVSLAKSWSTRVPVYLNYSDDTRGYILVCM